MLGIQQALMMANRATVLRPMVDLSIIRLLDERQQIQQAFAARNYPAAHAIASQAPLSALPINTGPNPPVPRLSRMAEDMFGFTGATRFILVEYRVLVEFRMAAVSLAVNLYHVDHNHWPVDLKSLVPEYLPAVPDDPFYPGSHPIGYILVNGSRPMLFCDPSAGSAWPGSPPATPCFGWSNTTGARQWLDVTNWWQKPAAPAASRESKLE
jgi:hypothetical protein